MSKEKTKVPKPAWEEARKSNSDKHKDTPLFKTEAQFMAWLRSKMRGTIWQEWKRYIPYKKSKRIKVNPLMRSKYNLGNRIRYVYICEFCEGVFKEQEVEIDHIVECGAMTMDNITDFVMSLCTPLDNTQLLCKYCHTVKTHMEKHNFATMDEAEIDKDAIAFCKNNAKFQLDFFAEKGYDIGDLRISNAKKRKAEFKKILIKEREKDE